MAIGREYSDTYVHFIAEGRSLALIQQYEWDRDNADQIYENIAKEYGGVTVMGGIDGVSAIFAQPVNNPLFINSTPQHYDGQELLQYEVNLELPEGKALAQRVADVPKYALSFNRFSKRLTGTEYVKTNPDDLHDPHGYSASPYKLDAQEPAAIYSKYGDTYVISVPRVVRGVFNEASAKLSEENRVPMADGYTFEWFTPPDGRQIPYSKVVELRENTLGDQLAPRAVTQSMTAYPSRRR